MDWHYLRGFRQELSHQLRSTGVWRTIYKGCRHAVGSGGSSPLQDEFDKRRGIFTNRIEPPWMLGLKGPSRAFAVQYQPIDAMALTDALARLGNDWSNASFLDLGCGKGRALVVAAEAGFGQVVGVELSEKLVKIARRNLSVLRLGNARVLHGDALDVEFDTENTVLFMYNPFGVEVMERVKEKIEASQRWPTFIIYFNPLCSGPLDAMARYKRIIDEPFIKGWRRQ